jgi:copper chaperone CopZ
MVDTIYCVHCGAVAKHPVTKTINGEVLHFCCGGCLQVYEMMREEELLPGQSEGETQIRSQPESVRPVDRQLDRSMSSKTIILPIAGMTCANCVAHVEASLRSVKGVINANVNLTVERATVEMIPDMVTMVMLKQAVEDAGYAIPDTDGA